MNSTLRACLTLILFTCIYGCGFFHADRPPAKEAAVVSVPPEDSHASQSSSPQLARSLPPPEPNYTEDCLSQGQLLVNEEYAFAWRFPTVDLQSKKLTPNTLMVKGSYKSNLQAANLFVEKTHVAGFIGRFYIQNPNEKTHELFKTVEEQFDAQGDLIRPLMHEVAPETYRTRPMMISFPAIVGSEEMKVDFTVVQRPISTKPPVHNNYATVLNMSGKEFHVQYGILPFISLFSREPQGTVTFEVEAVWYYRPDLNLSFCLPNG
jgi:hypothetical protein